MLGLFFVQNLSLTLIVNHQLQLKDYIMSNKAAYCLGAGAMCLILSFLLCIVISLIPMGAPEFFCVIMASLTGILGCAGILRGIAIHYDVRPQSD